MSVNSSDLIFDLSCLQGQIADVGISLQGLETQRLLNPELYINDPTKDTKIFIHDLTNFFNFINTDNITDMNKGLSTFYISKFLFNAMLTLNKFVNEAEYNKYKIEATGGVRPFNKTFSQNLYRLIKKDKIFQTKLSGINNATNLPNINFYENDITDSLKIKTREDLLDQTKFISINKRNEFEKINFENLFEDSYQVIIPKTFMTSENDFGNNMRKLITDLYKEYYYYEIVDIQKRLNKTKGENITNLDTNLRIMLGEVRNAFTREIYTPDTDISTEFPLSNIISELNDFINDMNSGQIEEYDSTLCLFDKTLDGNENTEKIGLYQFIEEKSHMLNQTGNAYHYALELSKRIQRISDYMRTNGVNNLPNSNPHFNDISEFTEDVCVQGIDEALAIISNLTNDLHLTTEDNIHERKYSDVTNSKFYDSLSNIEDVYHKYTNFVTDPNNNIFKNNKIDFNSEQLNSLGIVDVLKNANLFHLYQQGNGVVNKFDFIYNFNHSSKDRYENYNSTYITQSYYTTGKVARYENEYLYRNFSLIVIKIAIALAVLYIFRNIQFFNWCQIQTKGKNLRSTKNNEIDQLLSRKIPNDLTITDYTTITHLRKKLEKMKMQIRADIKENSFEFKLPDTIDALIDNSNGKIMLGDSLKFCYENILEFMNNQANGDNKLTDSSFISNTFIRLYPFTKSMLYQYDEYFSVNNPSNYNELNNSGSSEIKFGTILNGLNYVAQSVARNECSYKVGDLEKTLTKIIYLCTCLTVNWSDQDKLETTNFEDIVISESPLKSVMEFDCSGKYGLFVNKPVYMSKSVGNSDSASAFKTTILGFILGEMETIVNSNLPWVVKYVYWLSLYCINAYFIHLMKKNIKNVVVDLVTE